MKVPCLALLCSLIPPISAAMAAMPEPPPMPAEKMQQEMARVPASDPSVPGAPKLLDAVRHVHPRLLFTAAEIDALKAGIASDPLMQKAAAGNRQWANISLVPSGPRPPIIADDTSALVKSYSQAPAMAYAYALDKDAAMKTRILNTLTEMLSLEHWTDDGSEPDCNMGAACNMFMVALLYDSIYNDLDPDLRGRLSQKIFTMARRMYYLGHKQMVLPFMGKGYWQCDPQPNHRWYRDMGLAACTLAVADEQGIDAGYLLRGLNDEMDIVAKWYPPDGDCHEAAGYQAFGYTSIAAACEMMDRNLGTDYLQKMGLRNAWAQQTYWWVPGRLSDISWGDDQNSPSNGYSHNDASFFLGPHLSKDPLAQAALMMKLNRCTDAAAANGKPALLPWTMLAFYDPKVHAGDYNALPTYKLLPDIGAASIRDSWNNDAVVFTFKCGPYGGYKLNEYRNTTLDHGRRHYVNIAHDDPDANEFALAIGAGFVFHPGNYTSPDHSKKLTAEHSTITVDGKGQVGEGGGFTQPVGDYDMTQFSYLTAWKTDAGGHVIVEGEAGNAYRGMTYPEMKAAHNILPDPVLKTYRRTAIWMPKEYILILDNIVANGARTITWHGSAVKAQDTQGTGVVTSETGDQVKVQTVSDQSFTTAVQSMVLVGRWGNNPIQQIQLTANTGAIKFATVIDPWKKSPEVKITKSNGVTTVILHSATFDDTWTWNDPKDATTPSVITSTRAGKPLISLTEADKAPRE